MKKQALQLRSANYKYVCEMLRKACDSGKTFKLELSEWRAKATDAQRGTYFMWMQELADWANANGMMQHIYSTDQNGELKLVDKKPWDQNFAHEFTMKYFYPKNEDGSRMSLTVILKNRGEMCHLLDQLYPWCLDKGCYLTIPNKHWYWTHKRENGQ